MYQDIFKKASMYQLPINDTVLSTIRVYLNSLIDWEVTLNLLMVREYAKTNSCDYTLVNEPFFYERISFAFPKDNPWQVRSYFPLCKKGKQGFFEVKSGKNENETKINLSLKYP